MGVRGGEGGGGGIRIPPAGNCCGAGDAYRTGTLAQRVSTDHHGQISTLRHSLQLTVAPRYPGRPNFMDFIRGNGVSGTIGIVNGHKFSPMPFEYHIRLG